MTDTGLDIDSLKACLADAENLIETLPGLLAPHVEEWSTRLLDFYADQTLNFWSSPMPQDRVNYELDLCDNSDPNVVLFTGEDRHGDQHSYIFPWLFLTDRDAWEQQETVKQQERRAKTARRAADDAASNAAILRRQADEAARVAEEAAVLAPTLQAAVPEGQGLTP